MPNEEWDENDPRARVVEVDGKLVLIDPEALGVARAVAKHNCKRLRDINRERIDHFIGRAAALNRTPQSTVIVLLNVDDLHGGLLADRLMPNHDWQAFRDRGEIPIARGLAERPGIEYMLEVFDKEAFAKMRAAPDTLMVVVIDHGVAEVFTAAAAAAGQEG